MNTELRSSAYTKKLDLSDIIHVNTSRFKGKGRLSKLIVIASFLLFGFIIVYAIYSTSKSISELEVLNAKMSDDLKYSNEEIVKKEKLISDTENEIKEFEEKIKQYEKQINDINNDIDKLKKENKELQDKINSLTSMK